MTIQPLHKRHIQRVDTPLPPSWLRRRDTEPDDDAAAPGPLIRVGPKHRFQRQLVTAISEAQEVVLIASFLFSDKAIANALMEASRRGVRVYALTASEARLSKVVADDAEFDIRMLQEHKALLNRLAGHVLLRSAEHFHAKFLVTDPDTAPRGWLSTANFNRALLDSVELGVELTPSAAQDLAGWFNRMFWMEAERELREAGRLAKAPTAPATPSEPGGTEICVTTTSGRTLRAAVLELIEGAESELIVCSYGLDADHDSVKALVDKAHAGVKVTVLTRPRPAIALAVGELTKAGVKVLAHDKLHAKVILADDRGLVMSANLQARGLDTGFEVGVMLDDAGVLALRHVLRDWQTVFPWRFADGAKRSDHLGEICIADMGLSKGMARVVMVETCVLGDVVAACALALEDAQDPEFKTQLFDGRFPRAVSFEWRVVPPTLPPNAKERFREVGERGAVKKGSTPRRTRRVPYKLPVYDKGGEIYVLLEAGASPDVARVLAAEFSASVVLP